MDEIPATGTGSRGGTGIRIKQRRSREDILLDELYNDLNNVIYRAYSSSGDADVTIDNMLLAYDADIGLPCNMKQEVTHVHNET